MLLILFLHPIRRNYHLANPITNPSLFFQIIFMPLAHWKHCFQNMMPSSVGVLPISHFFQVTYFGKAAISNAPWFLDVGTEQIENDHDKGDRDDDANSEKNLHDSFNVGVNLGNYSHAKESRKQSSPMLMGRLLLMQTRENIKLGL